MVPLLVIAAWAVVILVVWMIWTYPYFAAAFGLSVSVALAVTAIVYAMAEGRR
jgi:hypothetical protein